MTHCKARLWIIAILVATLLAGVWNVAFAATKTKAEQASEQAEIATAAMAAGDYKQAATAYGKAATLLPKEPAYHVGNGDALFRLGEFKKAQTAYDKAIKLAPEDAAALCGRGDALLGQKKYDQALAAFEKALAVLPDSFRAHFGAAEALVALKRNDDALSHYDESVRLDVESVEALHARGLHLCTMARYDAALLDLDQAVAAQPDNPVFLQSRSVALRNLYLLDEAIYDVARAVALSPKSATFYRTLGHALTFAERYDEAIAAYQRGVDLAPKAEKSSYQYALDTMILEIPFWGEELEETLAAGAERAKRGDIFTPPAAQPETTPRVDPAAIVASEQAELAKSLIKYPQIDWVGSLVAYTRAVAAGDESYETLSERAYVLHVMDRHDDAIRAYAAAIEAIPQLAGASAKEADCLYYRAECYVILKRYEQALKAIDRAIKLDPDNYTNGYATTRNQALVGLGREDEVDKENDDFYIETNCPPYEVSDEWWGEEETEDGGE